MAMLPPGAAHSRKVLIERAGEAASVGDLFGAASERLRRLVPFDAAVWMATDPATSLPTAPTRSENLANRGLEQDDCMHIWELELRDEDVVPYRDLARSEFPAAGLRLATGDRPARSPRYRGVLRDLGFDDELRAVLRVDGNPWASLSLFRDEGQPAFDAREAEVVASLSGPLAVAVRDHSQVPAPLSVPGEGPGLILFGPDGDLVSVNDDALAWLDEVTWLDERRPEFERGFAEASAFAIRIPLVVLATLVQARAIAERRQPGTARARLHSPASGRWLVCHASCLREPSGEIGNTALVIEPANASEVAPIIVQAYDLSWREEQITQLIARGLGTAEIAGRLHLSAHTVRDYVKAIFEKVGVSSRGELVAKLFADHYGPLHYDPANHEVVDD